MLNKYSTVKCHECGEVKQQDYCVLHDFGNHDVDWICDECKVGSVTFTDGSTAPINSDGLIVGVFA